MLLFKKIQNLKDSNIKYKIFQKMLLQNVTLKIMQKYECYTLNRSLRI